METTNQQSGGLGFLEALTLVFIALKLSGHIAWNWFWVLSPVLFVVILAIVSTE
jgi:hypothetical protein